MLRIHSSWLWKVALPYRILNRVYAAMTPIIPKVIFETAGKKNQEYETDELRGWGFIQVTFREKTDVALKLKATGNGRSDRVVTLPIIETDKTSGWIFRNRAEFSRYSIEISYGEPEQLRFIKISTASALIKMIK